MHIFDTEYNQRFDGKWQKWGKVVDDDNIYSYVNDSGNTVTLIPYKWILLDVYDYEIEFVG